MAFKVAQAMVVLGADDKQYNRKMDAAGKTFDKTVKDAERGNSFLSKVMAHFTGNVLSSLTGGLIDAGRQAVGFANKMADMASDVNESLSKNQTLFGKHSQAIEQWANNTAKTIGISRRAALEASGGYGALFRAMGMGQDASSKLSQQLVTTAADLASFNNTSIEDAMAAIKSGLVGESEPLRAYGVMLNEAALKQQAFKLGLVSTTKDALTPQSKALATIALMTQQTAAAQGDFAKTAGGAANQQRILNAQLEDAQTQVGALILPLKLGLLQAVVQVAGAFNTHFPAIKAHIQGFLETLKPAGAMVVKFAQDIVAGFQVVQPFIAQFAKNAFGSFKTGMPEVQKSVGPVVKWLVGQFQWVLDWTKSNWPLMKQTVQTVLRFVTELWQDHGEDVMGIVRPLWQGVTALVGGAIRLVANTIRLVMQVINGDWAGAWKTFGGILKDALGSIFKVLWSGLQVIGGVFNLLWKMFGDLGLRLGVTAIGIGKAIWKGLVDGIKGGVDYVKESAVELGQTVLTSIKDHMIMHSPSKRMEELGRQTAAGYSKGIEAGIPATALAGAKLSQAASSGVSGGSGKGKKAKVSDTEKQMKSLVAEIVKQKARLAELLDSGDLTSAGVASRFSSVPGKQRDVLAKVLNDIEALEKRRKKSEDAIQSRVNTETSAREGLEATRRQIAILTATTDRDRVSVELYGKAYGNLLSAKNKAVVDATVAARKTLDTLEHGQVNSLFAAVNKGIQAAIHSTDAEDAVIDRLKGTMQDLRVERGLLVAEDENHRTSLQLLQMDYDTLTDRMKTYVQGVIAERKELEKTAGERAALASKQAFTQFGPSGEMPQTVNRPVQVMSESQKQNLLQISAQVGDLFGRSADAAMSGGDFFQSLRTNMTQMLRQAISDSLSRGLSSTVQDILMGGVVPATEAANQSVNQTVKAATSASQLMMAQAMMVAMNVARLLQSKRSGGGLLGGILGAVAGSFIPGIGTMAGFNIGSSLGQGDILGAGLGFLTSQAGTKWIQHATKMPGRAFGGKYPVGQSFMVGERGPEMLQMSVPGHIVPNHRLGGQLETPYAGSPGRGASEQENRELKSTVASLAGTVAELSRAINSGALRPIHVDASGWQNGTQRQADGNMDKLTEKLRSALVTG